MHLCEATGAKQDIGHNSFIQKFQLGFREKIHNAHAILERFKIKEA